MTRKNRYVSHAHLSAHQFRQLLRLFALDLEATTVADLTGLNRNTVNRYFLALRQRIARACEQETPLRGGRILLRPSARQGEAGPRRRQQNDCLWHLQTEWESLYGNRPRRDKAHPASHSAGGKVARRSVIHSDRWRGCDGLVNVGYRKHHRVHDGDHGFARGRGIHINGIESFWGTAKTRLAKRRGIRCHLFYLHLKECEFRFNHRHENLYSVLLEIFRKDPL